MTTKRNTEEPHAALTQRSVYDAVNNWLRSHSDVENSDWVVGDRDNANGRYLHWRVDFPSYNEAQFDVSLLLFLGQATLRVSGVVVPIWYRRRRSGENGVVTDKDASAHRITRILDALYTGNLFVSVTYAGNTPVAWEVVWKGNRNSHTVRAERKWFYNPFSRKRHVSLVFPRKTEIE